MKKVFFILSLLMSNISWGQIIISGYLANPTGTDGDYEYIQFKATQTINFSNTPYSVVVCNNGTATANGWAEGLAVTYKFNLTSGSVASGDVFYVGGCNKRINGAGSTDISGANWIRTPACASNGDDGVGTFNPNGILGNGGTSADGIAVFATTTVTPASVPIDAVFYGPNIGAALTGTLGYIVPTNDIYNQGQGLFGQGTNTTRLIGSADPGSAQFIKLVGTFNTNTQSWTTPRTAVGITLSASSQLSVIESGITLPVSFTSFSATKDGKNNLLSWATASEQNNAGFEVQRSTDGSTYENIGFVKSLSATGNSSNPLSYSFTDFNPLGLQQYYRLKQTDLDGKSAYSAIVLVKREAPATLTVTKVYPNPSTSSIYINAACPAATTLQLSIVDMNGRVVGRKQVNAMTGNNGFDMPVTQLAPGTYLLQVLNADNKVVTTEKFIKQ
jgi:hypothetical protein